MEEIVKVFGVNWKLLFTQAVNFGVLLAVLYKFLYRPLLKLIEDRREKIAQGLEYAADAESRLKKIEDERSGLIKKSLVESEKITKDARARAQAHEKHMLYEAHARSEKIIFEAQKGAEYEKEKIVGKAKEEIARMVVLGAEKILREEKKT